MAIVNPGGVLPVGLGGEQKFVLGQGVGMGQIIPPGSPGSLIPPTLPQIQPLLPMGGGGGGSGQGIMGLFQQGGALSGGFGFVMPTVPVLGQHFSAPPSTAQSGLTMGGQPVMALPPSFQGHPGPFADPRFPSGPPIPMTPPVVPLSGPLVPTAQSGLTIAGKPVMAAPPPFVGHPDEFAIPSFPSGPPVPPTPAVFPLSSFGLGGRGGAAWTMLGLGQAPDAWFPTAPGVAGDLTRAAMKGKAVPRRSPQGAAGADGDSGVNLFGVPGLAPAPIQGLVQGGGDLPSPRVIDTGRRLDTVAAGPGGRGITGIAAVGDVTGAGAFAAGRGEVRASVLGQARGLGTGELAGQVLGLNGGGTGANSQGRGRIGGDVTVVGVGAKSAFGGDVTRLGGHGSTIAQDPGFGIQPAPAADGADAPTPEMKPCWDRLMKSFKDAEDRIKASKLSNAVKQDRLAALSKSLSDAILEIRDIFKNDTGSIDAFCHLKTCSDVEDIADESRAVIEDVRKADPKDLRLQFLDIQQCILDKLLAECDLWTPTAVDWLARTLGVFMGSLNHALKGAFADYSDNSTTAQKERLKAFINGEIAGPWWVQTFAVLRDIDIWYHERSVADRLAREEASLAMAQTHILGDLMWSLRLEGLGNDDDWKRVGEIVSQCLIEKGSREPIEVRNLQGLPKFLHTEAIDVMRLRDAMRDSLKKTYADRKPYRSYRAVELAVAAQAGD